MKRFSKEGWRSKRTSY